jgi:crotonobetainyl-CoA:carnitine CoA-transferase CaiB-like acyl-CoA transferase
MGKAMGWGVYQLFPTSDGKQVFIAVTGNRHWAGLCDALGFDDWKKSPEFENNRKRTAEKRRIAVRITEVVRNLTYDDITARLYKSLVPYAPVGTPLDILSDRQMNEGKRWLPLKIGDKEFKAPKLPISMAGTRDFETRAQAGTLGAHTDSILAELGYSAADVEALKAQKVVLRSDRTLNTDDPE